MRKSILHIDRGWAALLLLAPAGASSGASLPERIESNSGHYRVAIVDGRELRRGAFNRIEFQLECDGGCEGVEIKVHGAMPAHGHGLDYVPTVEPCADGRHWCVNGLRLHMPGTWEIYFDIGSPDGSSVERAQATVDL
jgi:hypothetical protein